MHAFSVFAVHLVVKRHAMRRMYLLGVYSQVREEVMQSVIGDSFWNDGSEEVCKLLVGFVQVFYDKTGTILKSTTLVAYPVQDFLQNRSVLYRRWLVETVQILVGFLAAKIRSYKERAEIKIGLSMHTIVSVRCRSCTRSKV